MGKKIEPANPAPAIAESPASKISTALAEPPASNGESSPAKPAAKTKPAASAKKKAPARKVVTFSTEDIALRAYFISENRHRHGIHGDAHSDWVEAERQLHAEHKKKTSKKAPAAKKKR